MQIQLADSWHHLCVVMGKTSIHVNGNYVKISFSDLLLWNGCTPITFTLNEQRITGSLMSLLHASPGSQNIAP